MKAHILLVLCFLLGCRALSNKNKTDRVDCGEPVSADYVYVLDSQKTRLPAEDLQILVRNGRSQSLVHIKPTSKGCLSRDAVAEGDTILIKSPSRNEAQMIRPGLINGRTSVVLQSLQDTAKPKVICNHNVVDSTLVLNQFVDFNQAPFAEFYNLSLAISLDQALVDRTGARPLKGTGTYDLKHLAPGRIYDLDVAIQDFVSSDGSQLSTPCELDMDLPNLSAKLGDALKEFRTYYGKSYGVVDQGYELNFYIEGGLKSVEVDYCVARVNPEETRSMNPETACGELGLPVRSYASATKGERFDEGFWVVFYRYRKGLLARPWTSQRVMVRKLCDMSQVPLEDLDENFCTDISGNIQLTDDKPWTGAFELKYASSLLGQLYIKGTQLQAVRLPHVLFATDIRIESNALLAQIEMPQLKQVGIDFGIWYSDALQDLKGLASLERVGNHFDLRAGIASLEGLEKLQAVGGNFSIRSIDRLTTLRDLKALTNVGGILNIGDNHLLQAVEDLDQLQFIGGLRVDGNPLLERIDLSPLEVRDGLFFYENPLLSTLKGFAAIRAVQRIGIRKSDKLESLQALARIHTISGGIHLAECPLIRNFADFADLRTLGGLQVTAMTGLESLAGLENIHSVQTLRIETAEKLQSLKGLDNLERIDQWLFITENEDLRNLDGLESLTSLRNLMIDRNPRLESLSPTNGFRAMQYAYIRDNLVLKDLAMFRALQSANILHVKGNEALPSLKDLRNLQTIGADLEISGSPLITTLDDLISLEHVGRDFLFEGNPVTTLPKDRGGD